MNNYATEARTVLYQLLAEAFAEPKAWFVRAGDHWQIYHVALQIAREEDNDELHHAALALTLIPSASLSQRRKHYQRLILSAVYPNLYFHESLARGERLGGDLTIAVWTVYQSVGLQVDARLSPDHVSVELSFLSFLLEQEMMDHDNAIHWKRAKKLFIKRHVGQWLPALGDALHATNDPIYAPLGKILAIALRTETSDKRRHKRIRTDCSLPVLKHPENCTLCNFCVQACPTHALEIREDDESTRLIINDFNCLSCKKCAAICPTSTLQMQSASRTATPRVLNHSQRCHCPHCGVPTVSQAEIDAIVAQIGNPAWLDFCSDCRSLF